MCSPMGAGETFPGKYFRAESPYSLVNWHWNSDFVYKLFPDVVAFYSFVLGIALISIICHRYRGARQTLHRRIWVRHDACLYII